jgi:hypothetical protein
MNARAIAELLHKGPTVGHIQLESERSMIGIDANLASIRETVLHIEVYQLDTTEWASGCDVAQRIGKAIP